MRIHMKKRRLELGLTQKEVAKMAGLTRANYSHIETGKRDLNLDQMIAIAKALKIDFDGSFFAKNCDVTYRNELKSTGS